MVNKTGLIARISITYVLPTCILYLIFLMDFTVFLVFGGISRIYLNFAGPRQCDISEALHMAPMAPLSPNL